jgi:hypothetical protein
VGVPRPRGRARAARGVAAETHAAEHARRAERNRSRQLQRETQAVLEQWDAEERAERLGRATAEARRRLGLETE